MSLLKHEITGKPPTTYWKSKEYWRQKYKLNGCRLIYLAFQGEAVCTPAPVSYATAIHKKNYWVLTRKKSWSLFSNVWTGCFSRTLRLVL